MSATETRPDLLAALPSLVAGHIRTVLPGLRECRGMAGRLDVAALKARGIAAPAVLVTRLGCQQDAIYAGPHPTFRLRMAAFILCKDELGLDRDTAAANIAQVLLRILPGNDWGLPDDLMGAERISEEPLVSAASDKLALALTAVTWEQIAAVSPFPTAEPITPELYVGGAPVEVAP
ncbi:MAG: hypothetical protein V7668_21315 [Cereibacter changlensis]